MSPVKSIAGQRFGRLVALSIVGKRGRRFLWQCVCDCGREPIVERTGLTSGTTRSCGCLKAEKARQTIANHKDAFTGPRLTHGMFNTPTWRTWAAMIQRCTNPNRDNFSYYGGRGIEVCERWRKFENFLADMGERPDGLTLERVDNDGNYEPGNCSWATKKQQMSNRRPRGQSALTA